MDLKMLTEADCQLLIQKAESELETETDDNAARLEAATIAVWERMKFHVNSGRVVTMDLEKRIQLWEETHPC